MDSADATWACSACHTEKAFDAFSNRQRKRRSSLRRCTSCIHNRIESNHMNIPEEGDHEDILSATTDHVDHIESESSEGLDDLENETLQLALAISKAMVDDPKKIASETDPKIALKLKEEAQTEGSQSSKSPNLSSKPIIEPLDQTREQIQKQEINEYANIEASFSLENLVNELEAILSTGHFKERHIFNKVQMLMEHYDAEPDDYKKYAVKLDENQYTRNLIRKSPYFTLMLLCWPPQICSPIHDHGGSECWLRVCSGTLEERFYDLPEYEDAELHMRFSQDHKAGGVCFINDEQGLHAITNPTEEWAVSLHCYVPGYISCNAFADEKCASKGKRKCKMTFTTVDGVMVE